MSAVHQVRVIAFRANFCASDVLQLDDPLWRVLNDDVLEFTRGRKPADDSQRDLEVLLGIGGRPSQLARRNLHVLFLERGNYVRRGKLPLRQTVGVQPDAHRVFALAEDDDIADAGYALERVLYVDVEVVGDVLV